MTIAQPYEGPLSGPVLLYTRSYPRKEHFIRILANTPGITSPLGAQIDVVAIAKIVGVRPIKVSLYLSSMRTKGFLTEVDDPLNFFIGTLGIPLAPKDVYRASGRFLEFIENRR